MRLCSVGNARGGAFIHESALLESIETKAGDQRMRFVVHNRLSHCVSTRRNSLVAARTPATVDIQSPYGCEAHDRTRIRCNVHRPCPLPHQFQSAEGWKKLECCGQSGARQGKA